MKKIKLADVAERAGVSKSTASQYMNGRYDYMSSATRARLQAAVAELNYAPNPIARSLKTNRTKTIGVVVRDVTGYYSSRAIRGIDDFCKSSEYNVLIYNTDFDPAVEARALKALSQQQVDGLIIASSGQNRPLIDQLSSRGLPVVEFQLEYDDSAKNIIVSDYRQAAFEATDYLLGLGHTRICFVSQDLAAVKSRDERYQGYLAALAKHGLAADPALVLYWQRQHGFAKPPHSMLQAPVAASAFFSQHLAITTELLRALNRADISVPEQASVLGFDELPNAEFFKVPVTVIEQDPHRIGASAAQCLLDKIAEPSRAEQRVMIPCRLIKRSSCAAPAG